MASTIGPAPPLTGAGERAESNRPAAGKRVPHGRLALRRGVPLREGLLRAFRSILGVTRRAAAAALDHPIEAVHEYRKSIRRARALVELLRPSFGKAAADGLILRLKEAFAKTGSLRDSDILISALNFLGDPDSTTDALRLMLETDLATRPSPASTAELLKSGASDLRSLAKVFDVVLPADDSIRELQEGLARSQRRTREALSRTVEDFSEENFHRWRRRLKELRYQVELLASGGSRPLRTREKSLARLAQDVGKVTDLFVLRCQVESRAAELPGAAELSDRIRQRAEERARALLSRGSELFAEPPREFADRFSPREGKRRLRLRRNLRPRGAPVSGSPYAARPLT
jgi:CHAD domain-containing protein